MAKLGISTGTLPDDGTGDSLLDGAVKINSNFNEIYTYFGNGSNLTFASYWTQTGSGIHTLSNVGVGTTNPRFVLEVGSVGTSGTSLYVNGDARVTGILTVGTASITLNGISNSINVGSGVTINGSTGIINATSIVLGGTTLTGAAVTSITAGSGISVDQATGNVTITATGGGGTSSQWVSTAAGIHTLSNVGVGTTNPTSALTVEGNGRFSGIVTATTFIGALTGTATTATNLDDAANITTGTINSSRLSGNYNINVTGTASTASFATTSFGVSGTPNITVGAIVGSGLTVSGISTLGTVQVSSGIVTATSGIVTYYGDTSNAADGRWTLGADGTLNYTFTGIGFTQTTNDPVLYLARGRVYEFVNNSGGSHPFEIRVSDGGAAYSNGVTNNAAATGVIRFEIPFNAPNTLYYQCTNHSGMGNTISVYPSTI